MYPSLSSTQTHRHSHTAPPPDLVSADTPDTPWRPDGSPVINKDVTTSWTSSYQRDPSRDNSADPVLLSRTLSYPQESLFTSEMPLSLHGTTPQREGSVLTQKSVMANCAPLATRPHVCERDVCKAEACSRRGCGQYLEQECRGGKAGRSPSAGEQVIGTLAQQGAAGGGGGGRWGHVCGGVSNLRYHIQCNQPCTPNHHHHYLPPHNLCCPWHKGPHPPHRRHHHHSRSPHRTQVLSSKLCSPGLVLFVLLLLLLLMLLLVLRATVSQHRGQVTERQKGEGSKVRAHHYSTAWNILKEEEEEKEESTGEVLPGTVSLLPHLPAHAHAHALTVHQPDRYAGDPERDVWSFPSLQQRDKTADKIEIFLHSSVDQFLLTLHLENDSEASHNLSLVKDSLQSLPGDVATSHLSTYVPSRRFAPSTGGTWVVADVTKYLREWLRNRSEFSVALRRSERPGVAAGGGRELIHHHHHQQRGSSILQPVVCVQGYEMARSRDEDRLRLVVRRRLRAWKAREVVTWRPFGGADGGAAVPDDATWAGASTTGARRRREASTECQVSRLVVSLEDLGLRQVVYPTTLSLNYCQGSCHILDHPSVFSTNALLRAKYK